MSFTDDEIYEQWLEDSDKELSAEDLVDDLEVKELRDLLERVPTDEELENLSSEFSFFQVTCRRGCGTFNLGEVHPLHLDLHLGNCEYRCPVCNELQHGDLLVLD